MNKDIGKYIRVKNDIIVLGELHIVPTCVRKGKQYYGIRELTKENFEQAKEFNHWEVINSSDNLEDLVDLYVADKGYKMFYARENGFRNLNDIRQNCGLENCKSLYAYVYGENGDIIKVAKMNDKGELERTYEFYHSN